MLGSYIGKMLFVDLTSGEIKEKPLEEKLAKDYIGGYGLGAKILYDMMEPNADPLGPDNVLGFVTGPLTGTKAFFSGRFIVVCKSPASGTWSDSNCGGYFGPELKKAGYDAVFFTGKSEKPVYLWIEDGKAELRDAAKYWGMDSHESLEAFIKDTGEAKLRAALIGPAGENLSLMASVMDDRHRAAARGGCGAVMGSKNLKAVVVHGTGKVGVLNPEKITELNKNIAEVMKSGSGAKYAGLTSAFGTGAQTGFAVMLGDSPVKNWGGSGNYDIGPPMHNLSTSNHPEYQTKKYNCSTCPLGCGMGYEVKDGKWPIVTERPEYETLASFGTCCGNTNFESTLVCNDLCNRAGMDTISVGATVAWAIECFENGLINKDTTGGIELRWGDADAIIQMTKAIAENEGFGKILKLGSAAASKKLGVGSEYLVTASGIELSMHDPRCCPGIARTYQYDPAPGRHTKGGLGLGQIGNGNPIKYKFDNTGEADYKATTFQEVLECAGVCQFLMNLKVPTTVMLDYLEAATGMKAEDLMKAGERVLNMRHLFNIREGLRRSDFTISDRAVGKPALTQGPTANRVIDNEKLGDNFFEMAGWDLKTGIPDVERIKALGLDETVSDLYQEIGAKA